MSIKTISLEDFRAELKAQGVSSREHSAFRCPMCGIVQSMHSLKRAGVNAEEAERQIGFSCIGRNTGAGTPRKKPDGKPCNWTLGGLFRLHKMEVVGEDGKAHPFFEIATPAEAQRLEASTTK
jgi:hypothetical protein